MGLLFLFLCPLSVILATFYMLKQNCSPLFSVSSFACCAVVLFCALMDILLRLQRGDLSGVIDIYPTLSVVFFVMIGVVTAINIGAVYWRRHLNQN